MIQKYFVIFLCLMCTFTPPAMAGECICDSNNGTDCGSVTCGDTTCTHDTCDGINSWSLICERNEYATLDNNIYSCAQCPTGYSNEGNDTVSWDFATQKLSEDVSNCTMTVQLYNGNDPMFHSITMSYNEPASGLSNDTKNAITSAKLSTSNSNKIFMGLIDDAGRLIYDKDLKPTETEWTSNIAAIYLKWLEPKWEITICNYVGTTVDEECKNSTTHTITRAKPNLSLNKFGHTFADEKGLFGYNENKEPVYYYTKPDGTTFTPVCQIKTPNCWLNTATAESTKIQLFAKWTPEEYKLEFICPTGTQQTSATFGATLTEIPDGPGYFYPTPCDASRQIGWIVENDGDIYCEDGSTSCINNIFFPYNANAPESKQILNFKHSSGTITFVPKYTVTFIDNNGTFILP